MGGDRSGLSRAERKERICRELFDLRNRELKEPHPRQVVKKCPSPVAPTILCERNALLRARFGSKISPSGTSVPPEPSFVCCRSSLFLHS